MRMLAYRSPAEDEETAYLSRRHAREEQLPRCSTYERLGNSASMSAFTPSGPVSINVQCV